MTAEAVLWTRQDTQTQAEKQAQKDFNQKKRTIWNAINAFAFDNNHQIVGFDQNGKFSRKVSVSLSKTTMQIMHDLLIIYMQKGYYTNPKRETIANRIVKNGKPISKEYVSKLTGMLETAGFIYKTQRIVEDEKVIDEHGNYLETNTKTGFALSHRNIAAGYNLTDNLLERIRHARKNGLNYLVPQDLYHKTKKLIYTAKKIVKLKFSGLAETIFKTVGEIMNETKKFTTNKIKKIKQAIEIKQETHKKETAEAIMNEAAFESPELNKTFKTAFVNMNFNQSEIPHKPQNTPLNTTPKPFDTQQLLQEKAQHEALVAKIRQDKAHLPKIDEAAELERLYQLYPHRRPKNKS